MRGIRSLLLLAVLASGCGGGDKASAPLPPAPDEIRLTSPAFGAGSTIPRRFTCDGDEVSPPLRWAGVPADARELALVMEDRDAPDGTFVHWTVLGMRPTTKGLSEGRVPRGTLQTENSFGDRRYGGPCPPEGDKPHRYVFSLYALSKRLALAASASPDEVRSALRRAATARGRLTATYGR